MMAGKNTSNNFTIKTIINNPMITKTTRITRSVKLKLYPKSSIALDNGLRSQAITVNNKSEINPDRPPYLLLNSK